MDKAHLRWLEEFLSQRDQLERPDGRDIFRYRMTIQEFSELKHLLRVWLESYSAYDNLSQLARKPLFCQLFVIYGAEWWRRCYEGAGFSWEPIVQELGADPDAWNPQQRSRCIEKGLRTWKAKIRQHGALRYILSIALQGGLPMRLLATGRGAIGQILQRVLRLADNSSVTRQDIEIWVESLQGRLPHSYRQPAIFILLADIIITILQLKTEANLTSSSDAVSQLDQKVPSWRERFSLPLEDRDAQGLVEQLLRDAAVLRTEPQTLLFPVERYIEPADDGWSLHSSLPLPTTADVMGVSKFFNITIEEMPTLAELTLLAGEKEKASSLRRMVGHDKYRIKQVPWVFHDDDARRAHILQLNAQDGRTWFAPAHKGEELDEEMPWLFSASGSHSLLRQGGGKIAEAEALVALPADWLVQAGEDGDCQHKGYMPLYARTIWAVRGALLAGNEQGDSCRINTGRADATEENYFWRGKRLWLDFISPTQAFLGKPKLYMITSGGEQRPAKGEPFFAALNGHGNIQESGPVIARFPATGELQHRSRMLLLPEDASLTIDCQAATTGKITLYHWGALSARSLTHGVLLSSHQNKHDLILDFSLEERQRGPEQVEIEVLWPHSTSPVRLALPFPARGVRAFSLEGREWDNGARITVKEILGARLIVHTGQHNAHVVMVLRASLDGSTRGYTIRSVLGSLQLTLRLQDYGEDIQHLLAADDDLDATVRLEIIIDGFDVFHLVVARYAARLKTEGDLVKLNNSALQALSEQIVAALPVQATNLVQLAEETVGLAMVETEDKNRYGWAFSPEQKTPGPWLIYPAPGCVLDLRPLLWPVTGEVAPDNILTQAMLKAGSQERQNALAMVVETLALDFLNPVWHEVEQLAGQLGHLSLTALDIWRSFVHSPAGMAALTFRLGNLPADFVGRFARELPFAWEAVDFVAWRQAMALLQEQCLQMFGEETGMTMAQMNLKNIIDELCNEHNALQYLLGITKSMLDPAKVEQELKPLREGIAPHAEAELFRGDNCYLQKLLRHHAGEQWPTGCEEVLQRARNDELLAKYMCPVSHGFHDPVINLPLLLAVQAVRGQAGEWQQDTYRIRMMRTCHGFDRDWFAEAYNATIARCLADGLLD